VQNCHPPRSVDTVNRILESFQAGNKDVAESGSTWVPRFIHIRYFAVRDNAGKYRGCLEVTQDIGEIRALEGERRLLDLKDLVAWGACRLRRQRTIAGGFGTFQGSITKGKTMQSSKTKAICCSCSR